MKPVLILFIVAVLSLSSFTLEASEEVLPPLYSEADFNENGSIEHQEVLTCIQEFFYGHKRYTEEEIYLLIDFYLEHAE